jgi:ABC-type multidrug transport system fused ATPase/permease subunit
MTQENENALDLNLFLPLSLLILEVVAIVVLAATGYEITQFLMLAFILLGVFLIFQVGRQLFARWRNHQTVTKVQEGQALADAGENLRAIRLWKSLLFSLPKERFFDVLNRMKTIYEDENMEAAIQQVQAIQEESEEFYEMTRNLRKATTQDRENWKSQAFKLQKMIHALPEEPGQDLSDTKP